MSPISPQDILSWISFFIQFIVGIGVVGVSFSLVRKGNPTGGLLLGLAALLDVGVLIAWRGALFVFPTLGLNFSAIEGLLTILNLLSILGYLATGGLIIAGMTMIAGALEKKKGLH